MAYLFVLGQRMLPDRSARHPAESPAGSEDRTRVMGARRRRCSACEPACCCCRASNDHDPSVSCTSQLHAAGSNDQVQELIIDITPTDYPHHSRIDTSHGAMNFFHKQPPILYLDRCHSKFDLATTMSRLVRVFGITHAHQAPFVAERGQRHRHGSVHRGAHQDDHASAAHKPQRHAPLLWMMEPNAPRRQQPHALLPRAGAALDRRLQEDGTQLHGKPARGQGPVSLEMASPFRIRKMLLRFWKKKGVASPISCSWYSVQRWCSDFKILARRDVR